MMSCSSHPSWYHDAEDCPFCAEVRNKAKFLYCHYCGKCVSTGFIPVPTDTPDKGLIVRALIECPECISKHHADTHVPTRAAVEALRIAQTGLPSTTTWADAWNAALNRVLALFDAPQSVVQE